MGLFGDREDEYLDEDEKRLLRESLKRRKEAARQNQQDKNSRYADYDMSKFGTPPKHDEVCEADHSDEGGKDYSATANDDGCHADHSDDGNARQHVPSANDREANRRLARRVLTMSVILPMALFFIIGIIVATIPEEDIKETKPSSRPIVVVNSDAYDDPEYAQKMADKSQEILEEIMEIDYKTMSRKQLYNFIDETFPYQLEDEDFALCAEEVLKLFDYKVNAVNCINEEFEDFDEDDIPDIKKDLHKRGFTGTEIEYAVAQFDSVY